MATSQQAPYGTWHSPITADVIVSQFIGLGAPKVIGETLFWTESRPTEGGRTVVVQRKPDGRIREVTTSEHNVRTRVHEYGGGAFVATEHLVFYVNDHDQCVYRQTVDSDAPPQLVTEPGQMRYADLHIDAGRARIICVREDHSAGTEPENTLVALPADPEIGPSEGHILASGNDFYSNPRLSHDGRWLAWLSWSHPNMPWDGTELWVAQIDEDGMPKTPERAAGGPGESIFQPEWSPDNTLHFVSDRTGWWNLYRWNGHSAEMLYPMEAEFGRPQWVFGMSTYAFVDERTIACTYTQNGLWHLAILDTAGEQLRQIDTHYTEIAGIDANTQRVVFLGGAPREITAIGELDPATGRTRTLKRAADLTLDSACLSEPEPIEFPTEGDEHAYALYYPPHNEAYAPTPGERPPLLVKSHGGPTAASPTSMNLETQFWTSRGFAVVDVNYRGSTGYGRAYRDALKGRWGEADVEDCLHAVHYLIGRGDVDPERVAIRGSSAGGLTTLAALTFHELWRAGASKYGVSDLEALVAETHKFESRYLDQLIGPYPDKTALYRERSPIHHTDRLSAPVIFLQGTEDKVVPPAQAERMVEALETKGLPVAYLAFEGEQHGFRQAATIRRALEAELYFYGRIFGFTPADPLDPVEIKNLD